MKKLALLTLGLGAISCTNRDLVRYNTDRMDTIEQYLDKNKPTRQAPQYETIEKEAESAWQQNLEQY